MKARHMSPHPASKWQLLSHSCLEKPGAFKRRFCDSWLGCQQSEGTGWGGFRGWLAVQLNLLAGTLTHGLSCMTVLYRAVASPKRVVKRFWGNRAWAKGILATSWQGKARRVGWERLWTPSLENTLGHWGHKCPSPIQRLSFTLSEIESRSAA